MFKYETFSPRTLAMLAEMRALGWKPGMCAMIGCPVEVRKSDLPIYCAYCV